MNKLLKERAVRHAERVINRNTTVRNWTHEDATRHLQAAWLAGARSLDQWHRDKTRQPTASLVLVDDGQDGAAGEYGR